VNFILTAAHVVEGLISQESIAIRYHHDWNLWVVANCSTCELGSDVCAIRLRDHLGDGLDQDRLDAGILQGQEVTYCGFPLGMEMMDLPTREGWPTAFIKGGIFSGFAAKIGYNELLFDALNNNGFSGGPIIKQDSADNTLKIVGLVSRYRFDATIPVLQRNVEGDLVETADYCVRPNSGFMVGVGINRAINAARTLI
jgi:hypothetical protein